MPHSSGLSSFNHPNNILWAVQIMKFLILLSSPLPCNLVPFRSKYLPQHLTSPIHIWYYNIMYLHTYIHDYMSLTNYIILLLRILKITYKILLWESANNIWSLSCKDINRSSLQTRRSVLVMGSDRGRSD
jgi:hypothetical protein